MYNRDVGWGEGLFKDMITLKAQYDIVEGAAGRISQDMNHGIKDLSRDLQSSSQDMSEAIERSQESMQRGLNSLGFGLHLEFEEVGTKIKLLGEDFRYGFVSLISKLDVQEKRHEDILDKLNDIHNTLENPMATKALEFIRKGENLLKMEVLDKALESFLKAEEFDDTNFYTQLQIGKLYLFGIDEDDNIIDLPKAIEHFELAVRYIKGELKLTNDITELAAETCFYASIACYALGNENGRGNKKKEANELYKKAVQYASDAIKLDQELQEAQYHLAKYHALLGNYDEAKEIIIELLRKNRAYSVKLANDNDFKKVPDINHVYNNIVLSRLLPTIIKVLKNGEEWISKEFFTKEKVTNAVKTLRAALEAFPKLSEKGFDESSIEKQIDIIKKNTNTWDQFKTLYGKIEKTMNGASSWLDRGIPEDQELKCVKLLREKLNVKPDYMRLSKSAAEIHKAIKQINDFTKQWNEINELIVEYDLLNVNTFFIENADIVSEHEEITKIYNYLINIQNMSVNKIKTGPDIRAVRRVLKESGFKDDSFTVTNYFMQEINRKIKSIPVSYTREKPGLSRREKQKNIKKNRSELNQETITKTENHEFFTIDGVTESTDKDFNMVKVGLYRKPSSLVFVHEFILVKSGIFKMGSGQVGGEEMPVHEVKITEDFLIGKYTVTQSEYERVMGETPSHFSGPNNPVENVNWYDTVEYCNKLSEMHGLTSCYSGSGDDIRCNFSATGYRLPTEAEWEYAAKGGRNGSSFTYAGSNNCNSVAWYGDNADEETHPVGQKQPNDLGIYDMSGNVWEWCWDWYDSNYYGNSPGSDPTGLPSGRSRVVRGGSWNYFAEDCSSSSRNIINPSDDGGNLGFRVVRRPKVRNEVVRSAIVKIECVVKEFESIKEDFPISLYVLPREMKHIITYDGLLSFSDLISFSDLLSDYRIINLSNLFKLKDIAGIFSIIEDSEKILVVSSPDDSKLSNVDLMLSEAAAKSEINWIIGQGDPINIPLPDRFEMIILSSNEFWLKNIYDDMISREGVEKQINFSVIHIDD